MRRMLGHSSIKLTVDLYGHHVPGGNRAAVDKLDDVAVLSAPDVGSPPAATPAQPRQGKRRLAAFLRPAARRTPS